MSEVGTKEYQAALAWLFARTRSGAPRTPHRAAALLRRLGLAAPSLTVSVVGTNGKGSVTSMIAAGLEAAGHVTGRFISPHVEEFRERVSVNGESVSEERVAEFVRVARRLTAEGESGGEAAPAFFEWTLALALTEFARRGATAAVLEAGVGGASDATRAVEGVSLTVLTNVDLDHVETLGPSLERIAADKAGAMRPGAPFVSGARQPTVRSLVAREAARLGSPLHELAARRAGRDGLFAVPVQLREALATSETRLQNARLAAAALRLLGVGEDAVAQGLRAPPLPARGERFLLRSPARQEVHLDGAHDPAAARRLLAEVGGRPFVLLFGALGRKQGAAVLEVLAEGASAVVLTEAQEGDGPPHFGREAPFVREPGAALAAALELAARSGAPHGSAAAPLVLVAGSLYLAGRVRPLLRERGSRIPAPWEAAALPG